MQPSGADRKSKLQSFAAGRMDFGIPSGKSCAQSGARSDPFDCRCIGSVVATRGGAGSNRMRLRNGFVDLAIIPAHRPTVSPFQLAKFSENVATCSSALGFDG